MMISSHSMAQTYPVFGAEKNVTITGLAFDAMEPFLSPGGNILFFNSLNSGGNTNLYYASRINDSTFAFNGIVNGTYNPSPDHLDAVASLDSANSFYWVSTRDYINVYENLHKGKYSAGSVTGVTRVYGDFYIRTFGWLIMDAAIDYSGKQLFYCNAYFDFINNSCSGLPCSSRMGIAQQVNDSTFDKLPDSDALLANINDTNYIVYAPQLSKDGQELYFTRFLRGTLTTEVCVSVRSSAAGAFSLPVVLFSYPGLAAEAPTLSTEKDKLYYHRKDNSGVYRIFMRYRIITGVEEEKHSMASAYPNPAADRLNIDLPLPGDSFVIEMFAVTGQQVLRTSEQTAIDISHLPGGMYYIRVKQNGVSWMKKIVKK